MQSRRVIISKVGWKNRNPYVVARPRYILPQRYKKCHLRQNMTYYILPKVAFIYKAVSRHYDLPVTIFFISKSLLSASMGVRLLMSSPIISSRI